MRVERIARLRVLEVERQTLTGGHLGEPILTRDRLLTAHTVLIRQPLGRITSSARGCARIELEAAPHHFHVFSVLTSSQRGLKSPLADIAPRANDVRPDFYLHLFWVKHTTGGGHSSRIGNAPLIGATLWAA